MTPLVGAARPRIENRPPARDSLADAAVELSALAGVPLEDWQAGALELMLSLRPDGKWACREFAEIVGRQCGKTSGIGLPRALAGLLLLGEELIMWSAQQYRTAIEGFIRCRQAFLTLGEEVGPDRIALDDGRIIVKCHNTNGKEGFTLNTGQRLQFVARGKDAGRGFSADCMIIDEAYAYTRREQEALAPTMLARPNPQTLYLSSPPLDGASGEVLFALKERAEAGDDRLGYRDWGLPVPLDDVAAMPQSQRRKLLNDRSNWAAALPALGRGRVDEESILDLRSSLSDLGFAREILGCWPTKAVARGDVIDPEVWAERADLESKPGDVVVFAIDASPGCRTVSIASSGRRDDGRLHIKLIDYHAGTGWVVERVRELVERWKPRAVLLDPAGPAGALLADLQGAGIEIEFCTGQAMAQACGALVADITEDRMRHCGQAALDDAVSQGASRVRGNAWTWDRKEITSDICPLVAVTVAAHGMRVHGGDREEIAPWAVWV